MNVAQLKHHEAAPRERVSVAFPRSNERGSIEARVQGAGAVGQISVHTFG